MEQTEEIKPESLSCEKCGCTNIAAVKKGFSGSNAVIGYIIASIIGALILGWAYSQNDFSLVYECYGFVAIICLLSFFAGTLHMNDVFSVCLRCGHKTVLQTDEEKNATHWYESRKQAD